MDKWSMLYNARIVRHNWHANVCRVTCNRENPLIILQSRTFTNVTPLHCCLSFFYVTHIAYKHPGNLCN